MNQLCRWISNVHITVQDFVMVVNVYSRSTINFRIYNWMFGNILEHPSLQMAVLEDLF